MITICDLHNNQRFKTPINEGSKRVYKLMGDDYITLKFSVITPIQFKLGDYCVIPNFGRFELIQPYQPNYNKSTGGYDYILQLDAQYKKWQNKILRFAPQIGNNASTWSLTATAETHLRQILVNLKALAVTTNADGQQIINYGYLYNGTDDWQMVVDNSVSGAAKTISYDNTNILDALTTIAETFECEWWIEANVIHLGKCEDSNEYIDLELGVNVDDISRSDSKEEYVTRIIPFGSDRNISPRYRKDLIFDVKAITNGGNRISDTSRPLDVDYFRDGKVSDLTITIINPDGSEKARIVGAVYNPDNAEVISEQNWIQLPSGAVMAIGERFTISGLIEYKVPSLYFSSRYSAYEDYSEIITNGIVTRRLMLPIEYFNGYIDYKEGLAAEEGVEDVVVFEDVYPQVKCVVTSIEQVERRENVTDEEGTEEQRTFIAYRIKDDFFTAERPFDNEFIIPNQTLKIQFLDGKKYEEGDDIPSDKSVGDYINENSGKLNGWTFEVQFTKDEDGSAIWEIVRDNQSFVPNEIIRPEIGDVFVLEGYDVSAIDALCVGKAEEDLLKRAKLYLEKINTDPSTYDCTLMSDVAKSGLSFTLGTRINLIHEASFETTIDENGKRWGRKSRIIGFELNLDIPWDSPVYVVGEKPTYSRLGAIEDSMDALQYSLGANSTIFGGIGQSSQGGSSVYLIKQNDSTPPSDTNTFSALRSMLEFVSKKAAQTINYLWNFTQGINVGNYVPNNNGASIAPNGDTEVNSIKVREGADIGGDLNVDGNASIGDDLSVGNSITIGDDFQAGAHGGRIWVDEAGKVHIETDYLEAREKLQAREVEIQEETHVGGCQIISPAAMRCSRVIPIYSGDNIIAYKCFFTAEADGAVITNQFALNDLAKCETFNVMRMPNGKVGNHYYWRKVIGLGSVVEGDEDYDEAYGQEHYIILSNLSAEKDSASDAPLAGDRIITVGNSDNLSRQNLIILASYGSGSPYIYQYKGINTFALTKDNLKVAISPNGNLFTGRLVIENGSTEVDVRDYIDSNTELYQMVLSNEMAAIPCDGDGNIVGELPTTTITIYKRKDVDSGWSLSCECNGCAASIVGNTLYLSEVSQKDAMVTITATKANCPTLSKVMTIILVQDGVGMPGDSAVVYQIEPNSPMVLIGMDGKCDPESLSCKVYMIVGNDARIEVPLSYNTQMTTFLSGESLLFFNGSLFTARPLEIKLPSDLSLRYVVVTQSFKTENGNVVSEVVSETERLYTGAFAVSSSAKFIIFKLYKGNSLVDVQTVVVTTDSSALKIQYDTRFEITDKKIEMWASKISETEKALAEFQITADEINASVQDTTGIIQDFVNGAGRNLLLGTNSQGGNWRFATDAAKKPSKEIYEDSNHYILNWANRSTATFEVFLCSILPERIKAGQEYTFSCKFQNNTEDADDIKLYFQIADSESKNIIVEPIFLQAPIVGGLNDIVVTFTSNKDGVEGEIEYICLGVVKPYLNKWTNVEIWDEKLEKGGTPTAYWPAPEDREDYLYESALAAIRVTAEGVRSDVSKQIGDAENNITKEYTSAIEQKADEIATYVKAHDEKLGDSISEVRQTADAISLKVEELRGYDNLISSNKTGAGWIKTADTISVDSPIWQTAIPTDGVFSLLNDTASAKFLRTPLFTLQPSTYYTLSFECQAPLMSKGLSVSVWYNNGTSKLFDAVIENGYSGRYTKTFITNSDLIQDGFVMFTNYGVDAAYRAILRVSKVQLEIGQTAHPYVDDNCGLLATGIDIANKKVTITADNFVVQNNEGERSMLIDADGKISAKHIDVDNLEARHVVAGDTNGEHIEIDPSQRAINIYNEDNELCSSFNGQTYIRGDKDLYGQSSSGAVNLAAISDENNTIQSGSLSIKVAGNEHESSLDKKFYSEPWYSDSPPAVIFSKGKMVCRAVSEWYIDSKGDMEEKSAPIQSETDTSSKSIAKCVVTFYLEVADDSNFTKGIMQYGITQFGTIANASKTSRLYYDGSGIYHPTEDITNTYLLNGASARAAKRGYCRVVMVINLYAKLSASQVVLDWGTNALNGIDLAANYKNEFFITNFFANGFCLGTRADRYVVVFQDAQGGINFKVEEQNYGLMVNSKGIQYRHNGGNWLSLPKLVFRANVNWNSTNSTYTLNQLVSFDGQSPTISRTEKGHVHIIYPESWKSLSMGIYNTTTHLEGLGLMMASVEKIESQYVDIIISDGGSAKDGSFTIDVSLIN